MDLGLLMQVTLVGLVLGLSYSLIAVGLSLIFSVMRMIQFAHGHIYMLGAFAVFYLYGSFGLNYFVAVLVAGVLLALFGVLLEITVFRPLRDEEFASMIAGLGLLLLLGGGAELVFGVAPRNIMSPVPGVVSLLGVVVPKEKVLIAAVGGVLVLLLFLMVGRLKVGRAMRAFAQDRMAARLQGISINQISSLGMAVGSGLAAVAAGLVLPTVRLTPDLGGIVLIKAFLVIILGGLGSIEGALAGGLLLGFMESYGYTFLGEVTSILGYAVVMLILISRPQGLLGHG